MTLLDQIAGSHVATHLVVEHHLVALEPLNGTSTITAGMGRWLTSSRRARSSENSSPTTRKTPSTPRVTSWRSSSRSSSALPPELVIKSA